MHEAPLNRTSHRHALAVPDARKLSLQVTRSPVERPSLRMVTDLPEVRHVVEVQVYPVEDAPRDAVPGWEKGAGVGTLVLDAHDLFVLRHVRVISEEGEA